VLLTPPAFRATTFPNDDGYDVLIVAEAIPFHLLCMHHLTTDAEHPLERSAS